LRRIDREGPFERGVDVGVCHDQVAFVTAE
jgi:hypothetical protein